MFTSETMIDVRYAETDMMCVVYHANYFIWMEVARSKFTEDLGFSYKDLEDRGYICPVLDIHASFMKSAIYGEQIRIITWMEKYDGLRVVYGYEMYKPNGELACTGDSTHILVKRENFRPVSIAKVMPELHDVYQKIKKNQEK